MRPFPCAATSAHRSEHRAPAAHRAHSARVCAPLCRDVMYDVSGVSSEMTAATLNKITLQIYGAVDDYFRSFYTADDGQQRQVGCAYDCTADYTHRENSDGDGRLSTEVARLRTRLLELMPSREPMPSCRCACALSTRTTGAASIVLCVSPSAQC